MVKKIFVGLLIVTGFALGQDCSCEEPAKPVELPMWYKNGEVQFQFYQAQFHNWQGGGEDNISAAGLFDGEVGYETEAYKWSNELYAIYGRTKTKSEPSRKAQDEISAKSLYEYKYNHWVNPFVSALYKTQFAPGYEYGDSTKNRVSGFMDPGYLTESVGWGVKPLEWINVRTGGAAKQTWATVSTGYADDKETENEIETFKNEFGAEFELTSEWSLDQSIKWKVRYYHFINFKGVKEIDTNIANTLTFKVKDWLQVVFKHEFLYDYDVDDSYQTQSLLALNLLYTLF